MSTHSAMPQQPRQRLERLRLRYLHRKAALERAGLMSQGVAGPTPPTRRTDGTLALPVPYIYNLIGGGLNRDKLLGDFSTVQVRVGPWDFPNVGDTIRLHWGALWTREFPASTDPGGTLLTLAGVDIAGEPLTDRDHYTGEGTHAIWYEVISAGGGSAASGTVDVIVKTARPGGEDPFNDTPVNENLAPPTAAPNPVEEAATQCVFTAPPWKNGAESDTLTFRIGGYAYPAAAGARTVTLSKDQLAAVSGKATPVTYEVVDSVGNRSKNAPYLLLDIWSEGSGLLERIELVDDHGEFIQGAIDSTMAGIRARVPRYQSPPVPEGVFVQFDGTDRHGNGNHLKVLGPIIWKSSDYYLDFEVPNDYLQTVAGGFVRVNYFVDDNKKSYRRLYDVDALPDTRLPAPLPLGEVGNELPIGTDPAKEIGILIPDSEWLIEFSRITLSMRGQGADGPVLKESVHNVGEGEGHKPYTFLWKATDLQPLLDHEATFSYTIRTLDAHGALLGIHESEEHTVIIREAGAPGDRLAPPIVHDLVDGNLDPKTDPLKITVPAGHRKPARSKVTTTVRGMTTASRTNVLFEDNEPVDIDFSGWPALNNGALATAWYAFDGEGPSAESHFGVNNDPRFEFDESDYTMKVGETYLRVAKGKDPIIYESSNPRVLSVGKDTGLVSANNPGSGNIKAIDANGKSGRYNITATQGDGTLKYDETDASVKIGESYVRAATGGTPPYTYSSSNPSVVSVDPDEGRVTAHAPGSGNISVKDLAGVSKRHNVSVRLSAAAAGQMRSPQHKEVPMNAQMKHDRHMLDLAIRGAPLPAHGSPHASAHADFDFVNTPVSIEVGQTYHRTATGGSGEYSYVSSDSKIATVDTNGTARGVSAGDAYIVASDSDRNSGSYKLTVATSLPPFQFNGTPHTMDVRTIYQRLPTGGTRPYTLVSSSKEVAEVDSNGWVNAKAVGTTTITAMDASSPPNHGQYVVHVRDDIVDPRETEEFLGTYVGRDPKGGTPAYRATAADPSILRKVANDGHFTGDDWTFMTWRPGRTTVTITDAHGRSGSYPVVVRKTSSIGAPGGMYFSKVGDRQVMTLDPTKVPYNFNTPNNDSVRLYYTLGVSGNTITVTMKAIPPVDRYSPMFLYVLGTPDNGSAWDMIPLFYEGWMAP